jgi:LytS/YehU family sensor histidine kinase
MEYVIYESREKLIDVSKEIHFLNHYVELINRQDSHAARFAINTKGTYEKLKIAPLMLAGFIDSIVSENNGSATNEYQVSLLFSGNTMVLQITGNLENADGNFYANDSVYQRLKELYHEKFSYRVLRPHNSIELSLNLNEQ